MGMQTTTKIKLTYFNGKGRTEPARLILAYAGVDYEDCRIEFEDWPKLKPIFRFLANEYGLAGKTNLERARADLIADCVGDLLASVFAIFSAPEDKKAELQKKNGNRNCSCWYGIAFGKCVVLKSHVKMILDLPKIKKWIEERPVTAL